MKLYALQKNHSRPHDGGREQFRGMRMTEEENSLGVGV